MSSSIRGFINKVLSPNSRLELWLRTIYHKLNSTSLAFQLRDWHSRISCKNCFDRENNALVTSLEDESERPKISFILALDSATQSAFVKTIRSIVNLVGDCWEIICVGKSRKFVSFINEFAEHRSQIKFLAATDENLLDQISGDFVIFCAPGDLFAKTLLMRFYGILISSDGIDVYYYNCEYGGPGRKNKRLFFKPEKVSPALLLSVNYFSRGLVSREALEKVNFQLDSKEPLMAQEYRLCLRFQREDFAFQYLPYVLVSQKELLTSAKEENQTIIIQHLEQQGIDEVVVKQQAFGSRFTWTTNAPSVAVVIPTFNNRKLLEPLVNSLLDDDYRHLSITIVDNNSTDRSTSDYLHEIRHSPRVSVIPYDKTFNYSEAINLGAANSDSDLLLFLNDDMGVTNDFWLEELAQWAARPEIGVVGTKLIRANHTIQHAGIILGLNRLAGHIYLNAPENYNGLIGQVDWYRNYLAITGACQMVRRELFEEVGGYDEDYLLAFSDIDFCLKVYEKGYFNIYTPFASLYHYEGMSRGYNTPPKDIMQGYKRIDGYLKAGDPFYPEGLSYEPIPCCRAVAQEKFLESINRRKERYQI